MSGKTKIIGVASLILLWFIITSLNLVIPLFLPSPVSVVNATYDMFATESLLDDLSLTVFRLIVGFILGSLVGILLGSLMGLSKQFYSFFEIIIDFFRSIPVIAIFPLFLVIFGLGETSKVLIGAWSSSFLVLINTMYGVRQCSKTRTLMAKTMGANRIQIYKKIIFPGALPDIIAGLRLGISIALIVIIMTEMFMGTRAGLGQKILNTHLLYRIPEMYGAIILAGILGYTVNFAFIQLENKFNHWVGR